ncbi:hypothetical protein LTS10_002459 [Elasticomyces elasticus]|nr:hypothetical protein LTS10_002459 [Elasticomyces elasticus]
MAEQNPGTDKAADSTFSLLSLPPELWSRICRLAVSRDQPTKTDGCMSEPTAANLVQQPAITQTCKAIREETIDVFYTSRFVYEDNSAIEDNLWIWLQRISVDGHLRYSMPNLVIKSKWHISRLEQYPHFEQSLGKIGVGLERVSLDEDEINNVFKFKVVPKGPAGTF